MNRFTGDYDRCVLLTALALACGLAWLTIVLVRTWF